MNKKDREIKEALDPLFQGLTYGVDYHADKRIFTKVLEQLWNESAGKAILDIGAEKGHLSHLLKERGHQVHAVDIDPSQNEHPEISIESIDLNDTQLPYKNNTFDWVICTEVIEHLENPWFALREMARVLKRGGKLILSTPNINSVPQRFFYYPLKGCFNSFDNRPGTGEHITPVHQDLFIHKLRQYGFKDIKATYDRGFIPFLRIPLCPSRNWGQITIFSATKK